MDQELPLDVGLGEPMLPVGVRTIGIDPEKCPEAEGVGIEKIAKNIKQECLDEEMDLEYDDTKGQSSQLSHDFESTENDNKDKTEYDAHGLGEEVNTPTETDVVNVKQEIDMKGEMYICNTEKLDGNVTKKKSPKGKGPAKGKGPDVKQYKRKKGTCTYCNKVMLNFKLKKHMLIHTRGPLTCDKCGDVFDTKRKLSFHMKTHNEQGKQFTCNICKKKFYENGSLQSHMMKHKEKMFECTKCPKKFYTEKYLNNHIENVHGCANSIFACDVCGLEFKTSEQIKRHMHLHTGEQFNQCEFCQAVFSKAHHLQNHIRKHTGEAPFQCDLCGKRFRRNAYLKSHIQMHTGVKPFECEVCHSKLSSKWSLRCHLKLHPEYNADGSKQKQILKYKCDVCEMEFLRNDALKNHKMKEHTGEKPFQCLVCGVGFRKGSHLVNHSRQHTGETPYVCEVCGKRFRRVSYLRIHSRQHTGERPYECTICKKRFIDTSHLRIHSKSCSEEKRVFQCDNCKKIYTLHAFYKKHVMKCGQTGNSKDKSDFCSCKRRTNTLKNVKKDQNHSRISDKNSEIANTLQKGTLKESGNVELDDDVGKSCPENVDSADILDSTDDEDISEKDHRINSNNKDENDGNGRPEKDSNNGSASDNNDNVLNELSETEDDETENDEQNTDKIADPFICKICRKPYKL